jgi:GNAT superfamily N-acetyltransferase
VLIIRDLHRDDILACQMIVAEHWGWPVATHAGLEMGEMFCHSLWPPYYYVVEDDRGIVGFAGFKASWVMSNTYELIWVNVATRALGNGVGRMLTQKRLDEIKRRGGALVTLMTQKPLFFAKFGFRSLANFDGWELMVRQIAPVTLNERQA